MAAKQRRRRRVGRFHVPACALAVLAAGAVAAFAAVQDATLVSRADSSFARDTTGALSQQESVSADGRYVVFTSTATNLVAGTDTIGRYDVFLYERATGVVRLCLPPRRRACTTCTRAPTTPGG